MLPGIGLVVGRERWDGRRGEGMKERGGEREKGRVALAEGKSQNEHSPPTGLQSTIGVRPWPSHYRGLTQGTSRATTAYNSRSSHSPSRR